MQTIVDFEYYSKKHGGCIPTTDKFEEMLLLATSDIHRLTFYRINKAGFENLTEQQQALIKKACCYQMDYLYQTLENGRNESDIASYSAGNISVTYDTRKSYAELERVSEQACKLLKMTGLMQRAI